MLTDELDPFPDPDSVARALATAREQGIKDSGALAALVRVASLSQALGAWLATHPAALSQLIRERDLAAEAAQPPIGAFRAVESARTLIADLEGAPLPQVVSELSAAASAAFEATLARVRAELEGESAATDRAGNPIPFAVIGMGKLGGGELNLSSDVDVLYVYGTDEGSAGKRSVHEHFDRLAGRLTREMASPGEGFGYRVDLDLRPEGKVGPLVNSLRSLEVYYEGYGATWERAAWLKARPVAGDSSLGEELIERIRPFVHRRWLDYPTLEAIREMKERIDAEARRATHHLDVKLGPGGIRELEFLVQALQLVYAGKRPELRSTSTLATLGKLAQGGVLPAPEAARLAQAYVFLRRLEHRLQARQLSRTHLLPEDDAERRVIAHSMGFGREVPAFLAALEEERAAVSSAFDGLFREKSRRAFKAAGPEAALLSDPDLEEERGKELSKATGLFADPQAVAEAFTRIRQGPRRVASKEKAFRYLARLAPAFFEELARSPDADAAVRNLEAFLSKAGGRPTLLALLAEHPPMVTLLTRLFGASDHLAALFARRPELIDHLVGSGHASPRRRRGALRGELATLLAPVADPEERLDAIRRWRSGELLRIGMADLWGGLTQPALLRQLSDLADAVVERLFLSAAPEARGLVVLGMGRLGGREMTWGSDVDLVFLYEPALAGPADPAELHDRQVKLAQRVVAAIAAPTREGIAYHVDTRLRPSGSVGPLVVASHALLDYQRELARIWERQAWLRARPVAGDRRVWRRIRPALARLIFAPVERLRLVTEVREMRERLEKRVGSGRPPKYNLKSGRGGLVDVEFAAQFLQLAHAGPEPFLRSPNTLSALTRAARLGHLAASDHAALTKGYLLLSRIESRLRMVADRAEDDLPDDPPGWESLARRTGSPERFREELEGTRDSVRAAFERVVRSD